ncbi:Prolyl tripeptidyl peptidase precursor [Chryseobacterium gleum]|uniref:Prolyl tripeptidyl peptidase n=3 Tax=Chryseobacterium TaxID=59732 RepID=A0A3S5E2Q3_CHRGE|nr:prolyl oligopeptidase family serine peptidase [Chryseobacterium gleum]EFK33967.1 peptidase, S9A/B/C family, catalytic domain protein [Chryseobacterium gleum ATCC 35910]QQY29867.1 S9 family peptidase [Chryseobacterium gleum]VEE06017.1 Prolyl tripeptidyl peptidase precursor [Chryseobacterium gleum]
MKVLLKIYSGMVMLICVQILGQMSIDLPKRFRNTVYDVKFLKISHNDRWICFQKSYDSNSDTLVVVDRQKPNKEFYQKSDVIPLYTTFTPNGYLFLRGQKSSELLKLPSTAKVSWNNVKDAVYDSVFNVILLIQDDDLLIADQEGKTINMVKNVRSILISKQRKFAVVSEGTKESLYMISGKDIFKIYEGEEKIKFVLDSNLENTIILTENSAKKKNQIVSLSNTGQELPKPFSVSQEVDLNIRSAKVFPVTQHQYFVTLTVNKKRNDKNAPDIWYSNDSKLETKFYDDTVECSYLWRTDSNTGELLGYGDEDKAAYFGNPDYYFKYNPYKGQDYSTNVLTYEAELVGISTKKPALTIKSNIIIASKTGEFIITLENQYWKLYNLSELSQKQLPVEYTRYHKYGFPRCYFADNGEKILFESKGLLYEYDIKKGITKKVPLIDGYETQILNGERSTFIKEFSTNTYDASKPVIIRFYNREENRSALALYNGKSVHIVLKPTAENISTINLASGSQAVTYTKNTMKDVPTIFYNNRKEQELYITNKHDLSALQNLRSKTVQYYGPDGEKLYGILIYPLDYHQGVKYPMLVSIYEKQRYFENKYLKDGFEGPSDGINIRNLIQKGYFVYLPDISLGNRGTGEAALACVHSSLDTIKDISEIDFRKVGLIGFSHGGYETNYIATQSDRFAAYISGAGNSDLVRSYFSYNYQFNGPFYWQFENGQYEMPKPFFSDKELYIKNSPVYNADSVRAPILLWTGSNDQNIDWQQTIEYFLSLKRSGRTAFAIVYPNEGHGLANTKNLLDIAVRIEDWFDFYLKGDNSVDWIEKGLSKKDAD